MVKSGVSTSVNTRHLVITAMKEYENKSFEVHVCHCCPYSFCRNVVFIYTSNCNIFRSYYIYWIKTLLCL